MSIKKSLYDQDFSAWCFKQAEIIDEMKLEELDFHNLIEELENMGNSNENQLHNRLEELFMHLLKWRYQPGFRCNSWRNSIEDQRDRIEFLIKKNPSLKSKLIRCADEAYVYSRKKAARQTGIHLDIFPKERPFTNEQALDENWMPE